MVFLATVAEGYVGLIRHSAAPSRIGVQKAALPHRHKPKLSLRSIVYAEGPHVRLLGTVRLLVYAVL